jgi:hypothetical protein
MYLINNLIFVTIVILAAFKTIMTASIFPKDDILKDLYDTINASMHFNSTQDGQLLVESRGGGAACLRNRHCGGK